MSKDSRARAEIVPSAGPAPGRDGRTTLATGVGGLGVGGLDRYRRNLAVFALAWVLVLIALAAVLADPARIGVDSHAYWMAWRIGLYGPRTAFGGADAYLYSPAFAAALFPLTALPLSAFQALWYALALAAWVWLLDPVRPAVRVPLFLACAIISLVGNVEWLLAISVVLATSLPSAWAVPILTKVSFGVGLVWYVARGEWRRLAGVGVTVILLVAVTAFLPWWRWLEFLLSNAGGGFVLGLGIPVLPRAVLSAAVLAWGARADRPGLIPVAMVIASPNVWVGTFVILAAIPRVSRSAKARQAVGQVQ